MSQALAFVQRLRPFNLRQLTISQVMLAFVITAWIVVFMLIVYYLVAYNPELDPFRKEDEQTTCRYPNPVDFIVLRFVRHLPGLRNIQESHLLQSNRLESALNNV